MALHERPSAGHAVSLSRRPRRTAFKFVPMPSVRPAVAAQKDYPLTLVFGHSLYYWNQNVLIQHSETLKREYRILLLDYPDGFVEINIEDAKQLGIRDGEKIRLRAAAGSAVIDRAGHSRSAERHRVCAVLRPPGAAADPSVHAETAFQLVPVSRGEGGRMKARILDRADVLKIVDLLRAARLRGHRAVLRAWARHFLRRRHRRRTATQVQTSSAQSLLPAEAFCAAAHRAPAEGSTAATARFTSSRLTRNRKRAIFGIRSCDVAGHLAPRPLLPGARVPRHLLRKTPAKPVPGEHRLHRSRTATSASECFCVCADTGPAARDHFDLQLMDLGDEFMAVAGTPAGEALFADPIFRKGDAGPRRRSAAPFWRESASTSRPRPVGSRRPCATFRRATSWKRPGRKSATAAWNAAAAPMSARPAPALPSATARSGRTKSSACASGTPAP